MVGGGDVDRQVEVGQKEKRVVAPAEARIAQQVTENGETHIVELRLGLVALVGGGAVSLGQVKDAVLDKIDVIFLDRQRVAHAFVGDGAELEHLREVLACQREAGVGKIRVHQRLMAAEDVVVGQPIGDDRHDLAFADTLGNGFLPGLLAGRGGRLVHSYAWHR